jgi:thiol-disulfide isomerase/thioredoxin
MASRQWYLVGGIAAALIGGAWALVRITPPELRVSVGTAAPDYKVYRLATADSVSLRTGYSGSVTLINAWATYCVPCRTEMPAMERLYDSLGPHGFRIAAVSIDASGPEPVRQFAARYQLSFDILQDQSGKIQQVYNFTGLPRSFLINRRGVIVKEFFGSIEWDSPVNRAVIERLLQEPAT